MDKRRRTFLKGLVAAGALGGFLAGYRETIQELFIPVYQEINPTLTELETKTVQSLCLACNTRCGIRVRTVGGAAVKIDGNPYHPNNMRWAPIPYDTPVKTSLSDGGLLCLKGQEGFHWTYDPYRIRSPLKRAGPRGSMQWKPIPWDQLIAEVVEGGQIFKDLGEDRNVDGFRAVRSNTLIDSSAPELGPKSNQVIVFRGRGQPGRVEFWKRWMENAYGSANFIAHDGVCANAVQTGHFIVTDNAVDQMRVDIQNAKFIISFGDIYQSGQPSVVPAGSILPGRIKRGDLKLVVVDPRAGNTVAAAHKWIPVKQGGDGALIMGMIRWVLENQKYDSKYLENPNADAAAADGETTWTDATYLVNLTEGHSNYRKLLRSEDIGIEGTGKFVVIDPTSSAPTIADTAAKGTLLFEGELPVAGTKDQTISVKTSLQLLKEEAFSKTIQQWEELSGVPAGTVEYLAREFTSYGKKVGLLMYRAPATQYNGTYMVLASLMLQMLIGNFNWKGGYLGSTSIGWVKVRYDLGSFPKSTTPKGVIISREKFAYEKTSEYKNRAPNAYPATLPWFPLSFGGLWTETMSSLDHKYPYPAKIVITYFGNPIYSLPGGHKYVETFKDPEKVPLLISVDSTFSETSMLADYIVPDTTYLEGSLGIVNPYPPNLARWMGVRAPAVEPLTEKTPDGNTIETETFLISIAKKLGLPGYGNEAIPGPDGKLYPLNNALDYHVRAIVNLAYAAKVPNASEEEINYVESNYASSFVNYAKSILNPEEWAKMAYVIARGGYFEPAATGFDGEKHKYGKKMLLHFWSERLATTKHPMTGKRFPGTATWWPAQDMSGKPLEEVDKAYPFALVSYKMAQHTQSRTMYEKWALEIYPENYVEISEQDSLGLGIGSGDQVRVESASDSLQGTAKVTRRLRPGTVAIGYHYGHWAHGAANLDVESASDVMVSDAKVQGSLVLADPSRGRGIWSNRVLRIDDTTHAPIVDPIAGSSPTSGVRVKISKL